MTFTIRQGIDSAPLKQLMMAIAQLLMQKSFCLSEEQLLFFFHTEDGSSETEQVRHHRTRRILVEE